MTLGSLFDGSGGFPLGGALNGIKPLWASEIEPYPLKVTAARFPEMKQLGDVTKINGAQINPVDIITFGSPCQDLSVAGKQAGIHEGARSSLFFEAIRIIKEMRAKDEMDGRTAEFIRPRYAVWENVPGAFSSHGGEDFHAVLQALAETAGCEISVPGSAKWKPAGAIVADGWSIAWRVFDAQYWGVPQRRKRIYLVADFGGQRAGEILFERESVRGNPAQSGTERQGTAADAERSAGRSRVIGLTNRGYVSGDTAETLRAESHMALPCVVQEKCVSAESGEAREGTAADCSDSHGTPHGVCYAAFMGGQGEKARSLGYCDDGTCPTLRATSSGTNQVPDICYSLKGNFVDRETKQNGIGWSAGAMYTLDATDRHCVCYDARGNGDGKIVPCCTGDHENRVTDYTAICVYPERTSALCANSHPGSYTGQDAFNDMLPVILNSSGGGVTNTLDASYYKGIGSRQGEEREFVAVESMHTPRKYIVRRLTPLECCRLQGFPDWWEDGVEGSDSARYKMWGNGVALPCVERVMYGIRKVAER